MTNVAATAPPIPKATNRRNPLADAVQPVEHETRDRIITGALTIIPFLLLGIVAWQLAGSWLRWSDLIVFALLYIPTGFGITVGFHRLFTHRSFKTGPRTRAVLAVLGSAAVEGPIISWVAAETSETPGSSGPEPSAGSTASGPTASLIPQRPTICLAIPVNWRMSDSAPVVVSPNTTSSAARPPSATLIFARSSCRV